MSTAVPHRASADYATEVARLLWPEPWEAPYVTRERHRTGEQHRDAYLFPNERNPRLLVPADIPGSSTMLQRLGSGRTTLVAPIRGLLEHSVHSRAFALAHWPMLRVPATEPGADSIEHHLSECFGTEVRVGIMLGTRRVNQKPVLQVFDLGGTLRGYAKVGHNDLTAALVRHEAEALAAIGGHEPRTFQLPHVVHHGRWAGLEVLVISALATDTHRGVPRRTRRDAMREVSLLAGNTDPRLEDSRFWARLRRTADRLADQPDGARLRAAVRRIADAHGTDRVRLGGWHGDWGHWNMGMGGGLLRVWDWERYDPQVPIGFDGLHFAAQSVRPGERDLRRQQAAFERAVPATLTELGVPATRQGLTLTLYLLEIALRYVDALTYGETPPLRRRASWALSTLERLTAQPDHRSEGHP